MSIFELRLEIATPSQNKFHYSHWRVAQQNKLDMLKALLVAIGNSGNQAALKAFGKRRLTVVRFGVRKLDPSNLIGGLKGLIDLLVSHGLLTDDTEECLELVAKNGVRQKGDTPHTRIILEDL